MTKSGPRGKFIRHYRRSDIIFKESSYGDEMYIVSSGKVKLTTKTNEQELVVDTIGPNEFFGEMALVDPSPRTATAIAEADDTQLVVLNQERFLYLVNQQPPFALYIMQGLCKRLKQRWEIFSKFVDKNSGKDRLPG